MITPEVSGKMVCQQLLVSYRSPSGLSQSFLRDRYQSIVCEILAGKLDHLGCQGLSHPIPLEMTKVWIRFLSPMQNRG